MLHEAWDANVNFNLNLEEFRMHAIKWNMHIMLSIQKENKRIMSRLQGIQKTIHEGRGHEGINEIEKSLQHSLAKMLLQEEHTWFQISKQNILDDGDRSTRLYNVKAIQMRRMKIIHTIKNTRGM